MKEKRESERTPHNCSVAQLPIKDKATGAYCAIVETTQGSRNKMKYDPQRGSFILHSVLPVGTAFPYDFGFIPSTLGEDGDPLDVLIFMDETAPMGSIILCRLLGVIEAEQTEKQKTERNDRLLAVALETHRYREYRGLKDLSAEVLDEIERFFAFYDQQKGITFKPLGRHGAHRAEKLIATGAKHFQKEKTNKGKE